MTMKRKDPWTDPDPQPGDFDESIAEMGPEHVQHVEAGSEGKVVYIGDENPDEWVRRNGTEAKRRAAERARKAAQPSRP
jgi:hypothetical protein